MALFYFSRTCEPNPLANSWLVSGVIDAETMEAAAVALDAALASRKTTDRSSSFAFVALDGADKSEGGLLAITMGNF